MSEQQPVEPLKTSLEELQQRLKNAQPVIVDDQGRLLNPDDPEAEKAAQKGKTVLKPQRWYSAKVWYDINPGRLVLEKQAMKLRFPDFQLRRDGPRLLWYGTLVSNNDTRYDVALYYPNNFPDTPPQVFPLNPPITAWKNKAAGELMHQYNDGSLCLYYPLDRSFDPNTTAASVLAVAAAWFFAYEYWKQTGEWAGVSAPGH